MGLERKHNRFSTSIEKQMFSYLADVLPHRTLFRYMEDIMAHHIVSNLGCLAHYSTVCLRKCRYTYYKKLFMLRKCSPQKKYRPL